MIKNFDKLVSRWRDIESRRGALDFEIALWAADVQAASGTEDDFNTFHTDTLGLLAATTGKHRRMADAVRVVTDVSVWRAIGWPKVRDVARIEQAKAREKACARIVAEHAKTAASVKTAKVPKIAAKHVDVILAEEAPEIFVPAPAVPETAKDRQQARMAEAKRADAKAIEQAPRVPDRGDVLAKAIRRLVSGGYAFLADLLTPEERQRVVARSRAARGRTGTGRRAGSTPALAVIFNNGGR